MDKKKLMEAYQKMYEELLNGPINIDELREGATEENPNHKLQLLQLLFNQNPTGVWGDDIQNSLENHSADFLGNNYSFDLNDFLSYGQTGYDKWNFVFSLLHSDATFFPHLFDGELARITYEQNLAIEDSWTSSGDGLKIVVDENGSHMYIDNQSGKNLKGMYLNCLYPDDTSAKKTFCENIALYNAMEYYNPGQTSLSQIVQYNTEHNNLMEMGKLGTDPFTIPDTLEYYGYSSTSYHEAAAGMITPNNEQVVIISALNEYNNPFGGVHTYTLIAKDGYYYAYNAYTPSDNKPYSSVGEFLVDIDAYYNSDGNNGAYYNDYKDNIEVIEILGVSQNEE